MNSIQPLDEFIKNVMQESILDADDIFNTKITWEVAYPGTKLIPRAMLDRSMTILNSAMLRARIDDEKRYSSLRLYNYMANIMMKQPAEERPTGPEVYDNYFRPTIAKKIIINYDIRGNEKYIHILYKKSGNSPYPIFTLNLIQ